MATDPFDAVSAVDPELADVLRREVARQNTTIQLIASENFTSPAVMAAQGSVLTNKYAEGYPGKRYYGGGGNPVVAGGRPRRQAGEKFRAGTGHPPPPPRRPQQQSPFPAPPRPRGPTASSAPV